MTEYLAENSRLKQASRLYAKEQMSLADFRLLRRNIIDALEAGQVGVYEAVEEPLPFEGPLAGTHAETDVLYKTMPPNSGLLAEIEAALSQEGDEPVVADWDSNTRILAIVLAVALLIALLTLLYVLMQ